MPIYDYLCGACDRVTEVIHGINDQGPRFCPNCGAEGTMRKALTAPAIVFKGSGWAKVDRRSSSSGSSAGRSARKPGSPAAGGAGDGAGTGTSGAGATSGSGSADASGGKSGTASSSDGGGD